MPYSLFFCKRFFVRCWILDCVCARGADRKWQVGFPVMILSTAIANCYLLFLNAVFWQKNVVIPEGAN